MVDEKTLPYRKMPTNTYRMMGLEYHQWMFKLVGKHLMRKNIYLKLLIIIKGRSNFTVQSLKDSTLIM